MMKISIIIVLIIFHRIYAVQKYFLVNRVENCPVNRLVDVFVEINKTANIPNTIVFSGYMKVLEKVSGPIEMSLDTNRCDVSMNKCEKYAFIKVSSINVYNK